MPRTHPGSEELPSTAGRASSARPSSVASGRSSRRSTYTHASASGRVGRTQDTWREKKSTSSARHAHDEAEFQEVLSEVHKAAADLDSDSWMFEAPRFTYS
ncbi:uncharacterized protein LOC142356823 [Convolutriloba macropyga]|uniref:uncharacterized protein LOC142356823 n=1 Tax=Convolutriloba macropyga TaxID=536237 RepID=UPI003F524B55